MNEPERAACAQLKELPWAIAEAHNSEYEYQLRFRVFPSDFPRLAYPVRLSIFWAMDCPDPSGLASPEDLERMHVFEERLVHATEPSVALLGLVVTGRGEREFVLYSKSASDLLRRLEQMPQEDARYPIKIYKADDPEWSYLEGEIRSVRPA